MPSRTRASHRRQRVIFGFPRVASEQVTEAEQARQSRGDKFAEAVAAEVRAGQTVLGHSN